MTFTRLEKHFPFKVLWILLISGFFPLVVAASDLVIREIVSDTEICFEGDMKREQVLAIFSHDSDEVVGYATITKFDPAHLCWLATVKTHRSEGLVRVGNRLVVLDLSKKNSGIPARYDLLVEGLRDTSARYKPMVYIGSAIGQTAALLDQKEHIFGFGIYGYGLSPRVQFDTTTYENFFGILNAGVKTKIFENDEYRFSAYAKGYYSTGDKSIASDLELTFDSYSNSRFATFYKISYKLPRTFRDPLEPINRYQNAVLEYRAIAGIMLGNWDRIHLGPKYSLDNGGEFGGYVSYVFIADRFHFLLGAEISNILKVFTPNTVLFSFDFFWRL